MTLSFDTVGINATELTLLSQADVNRVLDDIAAYGFTHVRVEIPWQLIQPTQQQWIWGSTTWNGASVAGADVVITAAKARGLTVLPILGVHMATWAPTDGVAFGEFARRAHERYDLPAYEIMNETNLAAFSTARWSSPSYLVPLLKAASLAIPDAEIVSGGMAAAVTYTGWAFVLGGLSWFPWIPWPVQFHNDSPEDYLRGVIQGGGPFNIAGYHPYSIADDLNTDVMPSADQPMIKRCKTVADLTQKPVWATEYGFDAARMTPADISLRYEVQMPLVDAVCDRQYLFCWRDSPLHGGRLFGLVDANNKPRQPLYDHVDYLIDEI